MMTRLLLAILLLWSGLANAQTNPGSIPAHAMPVSKGPGVSGYAAGGPCSAGQVLAWVTGPAADPSCQSGGSGTITSLSAGTGITLTPSPITTSGTISLTIPVVVSSGGTGATSLTAHGLLVGEGTSAITALTAMSNGQVAIGQTGADPIGRTITGDITLSSTGVSSVVSNAISNNQLYAVAANTMKGNWTSSTANEADNAMPSCSDSGGNHLNYVSGTGVTCGTSVPSGTGTVTSLTSGTGITLSPSTITTSGSVSLTVPVAVSSGGTGNTTLTSHGVLLGNGTSAVAALAEAAAGTVLGGVAASNPAFTATPTLGISGTTTGTIALAGNSSGTVTIKPQAAAGTYNFNLPITAGTLGQPLLSGGGSTTPQTYGTLSTAAGGTTTSSFTPYAPIFGGTTSTGALQSGGLGTLGQVFTSNGPGALGTFQAASAGGTVTSVTPGAGLMTTGASPITTSDTLYIQQLTPGGRLTLSSGVPVMVSSVTTASTVYYAPYIHPFVPINNSTVQRLYQYTSSTSDTIGQSVVLGSNWAANSNYDFFIGLDSGTVRLCTGPAWTSDTGRGSGAGTTQLSFYNGVNTNTVSMTCRYNNTTTFTCAVTGCTYLGTMRTSSSTGTVNHVLGSLAANGGAAYLGLWNAYNRVNVVTMVGDSTDTWTYRTATWRSANGSTNNRVSYIHGLNEDGITAQYSAYFQTEAAQQSAVAVGVDTTSTFSGSPFFNRLGSLVAHYSNYPGLGFHFAQAVEIGAGAGDTTGIWGGDGAIGNSSSAGVGQMGLLFQSKY